MSNEDVNNRASIVKDVSEIMMGAIDNKIELTLNRKFAPIQSRINALIGAIIVCMLSVAFSFGMLIQKFDNSEERSQNLYNETLIMHHSLSKLDPDLPPLFSTRGNIISNSKSSN